MKQTIYEMIADLQKRLKQVEEENDKLKSEIQNIKPIVIENINYKIQELNVKELSGTLNIGMSGELDPENLGSLFDGEEESSEAASPEANDEQE
ncbi:spore germination protein GerPC [Pseudalkalibacillus caeni]|nr:spore germination protein GerPC [Pseudalkalibacillus caeni]